MSFSTKISFIYIVDYDQYHFSIVIKVEGWGHIFRRAAALTISTVAEGRLAGRQRAGVLSWYLLLAGNDTLKCTYVCLSLFAGVSFMCSCVCSFYRFIFISVFHECHTLSPDSPVAPHSFASKSLGYIFPLIYAFRLLVRFVCCS